jgi:hypothetical protein
MINSLQRPLPDNTQQSQRTNIHDPVGFEPKISASQRPQTYALDRVDAGTASFVLHNIRKFRENWFHGMAHPRVADG